MLLAVRRRRSGSAVVAWLQRRRARRWRAMQVCSLRARHQASLSLPLQQRLEPYQCRPLRNARALAYFRRSSAPLFCRPTTAMAGGEFSTN